MLSSQMIGKGQRRGKITGNWMQWKRMGDDDM